MALIILALVFLVLVELYLSTIRLKDWQKSLGLSTMVLVMSLSLSLFYVDFSVFSVLVNLISLFRVINIARLLSGNKQQDYLANIFRSSAIYLTLYLIIISLVEYLVRLTNLSNFALVAILVTLQCAASLLVAWSLERSYRKTKIVKADEYIENKDLPSLTVAIPARNETKDLQGCLDSLVGSDYPKLEILVLDDCSQTKKTPEIIKGYAQAGIRFVEGKVPSESWTAKNYAYEQLVEQSSSELILFCGVDVRFNKDTLRQMVEVLINKKKSMVSFMPVNIAGDLNQVQKLAVQPWRYFWELCLPRRQFNRPPVLSTCWLIYGTDLKAIGGFKAVSRNILPERYFARQVAIKNQGYSFVRTGGGFIDFKCQKDHIAQLSTAKRTLYPLLGSRLDNVLIVSLAKLTVIVLPFIFFIGGMLAGNYWVATVSIINFVVVSACFALVAKLTYNKNDPVALLFMPFVAVFDIYLTLKSMWLYEFREVIWKDRNVCIPVMRVVSDQAQER